MSPQSIILTYTGSLRMRLQSIYLTCTHTFFQLYKLSTQFAQANDRHIQNQYSLYIHVFPTLRTITQFAQAKDRHIQNKYSFCRHVFFQHYELSPYFAQAKDRHIQNKYNLYIHVFPTLRTITLVCLDQRQTHSKQVQPLYTRFSNSNNYHLSLPRPKIDTFKTSIDTFKTSIAFTHTFFQLYELSTQFAQAKDTHTHVFPTTNYQLSLPRPKTDTFKTSIAFMHTIFQLCELSPQFAQAKDRHIQNKSSLYTHFFFQLYELSPQFAQAKNRHIRNKYSLYAHFFPTLRTITLVCLGQGQTQSKQVQLLQTLFFFLLYELSPQLVQAKDRHIQNKYSLLWCLPMEQVPSDSHILSLAQLPQSKTSCTP